MTVRFYVATVHLLIRLDDDQPGMEASQAAACDVVSGYLEEAYPDIADWGYARTIEPVQQALDHPASDGRYAAPIEVVMPPASLCSLCQFPLDEHAENSDHEPEHGDTDEGAFYDVLPSSHRIVKEDE